MAKKYTCPETGRKMTNFEAKWGIHAVELANEEMVKPEALHMRIKLFGSPFQRGPLPFLEELMYGKTRYEMAQELDIHPGSLMFRLKETGDAYYESPYTRTSGMRFGGEDWRERKAAMKPQGWLSHRHPFAKTWRVEVLDALYVGETERLPAKGCSPDEVLCAIRLMQSLSELKINQGWVDADGIPVEHLTLQQAVQYLQMRTEERYWTEWHAKGLV